MAGDLTQALMESANTPPAATEPDALGSPAPENGEATEDPGVEMAAEEVMGALSAGDTQAFVSSLRDLLTLIRANEAPLEG